MGSFRALTFASLLAVGAAQAAQAADLLPPPIEAPPLRGAVVDDPGGFYLRADAGLANNMADGLRSTYGDPTFSGAGVSQGPVSIGDSGILGLGLGYQFNSWLRADVTGEYRNAAQYGAGATYKFDSINNAGVNTSECPATAAASNTGDVLAATSCGDGYAAQVKIGLILANAYLDMGTWYGFTPYVGGGVGTAIYNISGLKDTGMNPNGSTSFGYAANHTGDNFAWALMAGAAYHITPNLLLDVGYRYADMGTFDTGTIVCNQTTGCHYEKQHFKFASNDVRVGLRWMAGPAIYDPGLPVRAKY